MADHRGLVIVDGVTQRIAVGDRVSCAGINGDDGYDITLSSWTGYAINLQGNVDLGGSSNDTVSFVGYIDSTTIYLTTGANHSFRVATSTTGNGNTLGVYAGRGRAAATYNAGAGGAATITGGTGGTGAAGGYTSGAGGASSVAGGLGGAAASTSPGSVGGSGSCVGGNGGAGTSGVAPGAGGNAYLTAGNAGTLNGGTGANGGWTYVNAGAGSGTGIPGYIYIGSQNCAGLYLGNATNNPVLQKLGTGDTYWNGNIYFANNVILGNDSSDQIIFNGSFVGSIVFASTSTGLVKVGTPASGTGNPIQVYGADGANASGANAGNGGAATIAGGNGGNSATGYTAGYGGYSYVQGGNGGDATAGSQDASYGGYAYVLGGTGGQGASGQNAGVGGGVTIQGGSAGATNGGSGNNGGDVFLNGGFLSGAGSYGRVYVGYTATSHVYLSNATNNAPVTKQGSGTTTWNGPVNFVAGNLSLCNSSSYTISVNGKINTAVLPNADNTYGLGASGQRWSYLYATTVYQGDLGFTDERCLNCGEEFEVGDEISWVVVDKKRTENGLEYLSRPKHLHCP